MLTPPSTDAGYFVCLHTLISSSCVCAFVHACVYVCVCALTPAHMFMRVLRAVEC